MADLVTLTIDGKEISVPRGTTILHAAETAGIEIPHLCYCPGLKGTGACRICLVQIEKVKGLVVSCMRKVAPEMVVHTNTEEIREARRFVVELLLSRHPGLCLSCEKSGSCRLQQYAYELGIERPSFPVRDPGHPVDESNPFIVRNYNLCILCGRCIRVCRTQGSDILDFMKRGIETRVSTALDKPLQEAGCDFCGSCVGVCPTAALVEKSRRGKGREWEFTPVRSYCGYCGSACALYYNVKKDEIVKVTTEAPADYLCVRGRFGYGYLTSGARLTAPLVRKNGELVPAEWEEALELTARRFRELRDEYGPQGVGGIVGALVSNEAAYAFQKFIRVALKSGNVDSGLRFGGLDLLRECDGVLGGPKGYASLEDIAAADVLLVVGDVWRRVPAVWGRIKRAADRGGKVVYLGVYAGRPTRVAQVWLRPVPGAEHLVLQQVAAAVLRQMGERVRQQVAKFSAFKKEIAGAAAVPTGVGAEEIVKAAELWADRKAKGVVVLAVDGVTPETGRAALNLCLLTGRLKRAFFLGHSLANAQGVWRMGAAAGTLPGLQTGPRAAARFARLWGAALPDIPGLTAKEMLAEDSPVRGLYVLGENPVASFPGCDQVAARLKKLEFLVVQDLFLTETAGMADVVLPLAATAETGGTCINVEGEVRQFREVLPAKTLAAWEVIGRLASKVGLNAGYGTLRQLKSEILTAAPGYGVKAGGAPRPTFLPVGNAVPEAGPDGSLRLVPLAARFGFYEGSWALHGAIRALCRFGGDCVGLAPEDAERLGLEEGTAVAVATAYGRVTAVVRIDPGLPPGVAAMPAFTAKTNALLIPEAPNKPVAVEVTKL